MWIMHLRRNPPFTSHHRSWDTVLVGCAADHCKPCCSGRTGAAKQRHLPPQHLALPVAGGSSASTQPLTRAELATPSLAPRARGSSSSGSGPISGVSGSSGSSTGSSPSSVSGGGGSASHHGRQQRA